MFLGRKDTPAEQVFLPPQAPPFFSVCLGALPLKTPAGSRFGYSVFWIELSQSVRHSDYSFAKLSEAQDSADVAGFYVSKFVCV